MFSAPATLPRGHPEGLPPSQLMRRGSAMSMFQDLLGKISAAAGKSGEGEGKVGGLLGQLLGSKGEGVHDLLDKMKAQGLGDVANSWIGKGKNLSIDPDKIKEILGSDQMKALAQRLGLPQDKIADLLAKHLPGVVDKMSPEGKLPTEIEEEEESEEETESDEEEEVEDEEEESEEEESGEEQSEEEEESEEEESDA